MHNNNDNDIEIIELELESESEYQINQTQSNQVHPSGFWYVDKLANLNELLENIPAQIKVRNIKRGQIFIQTDIPYTVKSIATCKPESSHPKLNFTAWNEELDKNICLVYPENYLLDLNLDNNILIK